MNKILTAIRRILGSEPMPLNASAPPRQVHIYTIHPVTGQDANDFPDTLDEERRAEIAQMFRDGARFYWHQPDDPNKPGLDDGYERIEYGNFEFVVRVLGQQLITHH